VPTANLISPLVALVESPLAIIISPVSPSVPVELPEERITLLLSSELPVLSSLVSSKSVPPKPSPVSCLPSSSRLSTVALVSPEISSVSLIRTELF
jgi:hypothetical protein